MGKNGLCKDLVVAEHVSKEKCCELGGSSVATSWSPNDLDDGALFFWRVLGDGVPCARCKGNGPKNGKIRETRGRGRRGGVLVQLSTTGESRPFIPISLSELCPFRISKIIRIYNIYETGRSAGCKLRRFLIFPFFYGAFRLFRTNNTFGNFKRIPSERYNIETNDQKRLGKTECRFEVFRNSLSPWLFRTFPTSTPVPDLWSATTPEFFYPTSKVYFPVSRRIGDE